MIPPLSSHDGRYDARLLWQDLEGRLDVTIAAASGVLIVATVALLILMERTAGLSRRLR